MSAAPKRLAALEQMRRAKIALLRRDPGASLAEVIYADRDAFSSIRMLFASDIAGVTLEQIFDRPPESVPVVRIFAGKGLLAFSDEIEQQMRAGDAPLRYGTRTLLDTNFLSLLPKLCDGSDFDTRAELEETLEFIDAKLGRTLEWTFASLENMREVIKPNNPAPVRKVAAAKFLDAAPKAFRTRIGSVSMLDEYIPAAEAQWRSWMSSPFVWQTLRRRDLLYAVMLAAMLECWSGSSVVRGLGRLVDWCLDKFGFLPLKELYFSWKALAGFANAADRLAIFNEAPLILPSRKSLGRISALAWDLFLFRWCETLCTQMKNNSFYVPVITTLDRALLKAVKSCPLRAILINDGAGMVEALFDDELIFQDCLNSAISPATLRRIEDPERRSKTPDVSDYALSSLIKELEADVGRLA